MNDTENKDHSLPPHWERAASIGTRLFVWCVFFCALYFLRSFFLLIFLTFVFSYLQAHAVHNLGKYTKTRTLAVTFVGLCFLAVLVAVGAFAVPRITSQANTFADNYFSYLQAMDAELISLSDRYPLLKNIAPTMTEGSAWSLRSSPSAQLFHQMFGLGSSGDEATSINDTVNLLRNIGRELGTIGSAFFLAVLFSFMIVLDLPRLTKSVTSLGETKLAFIYEEVAGSVRTFGETLGRMLEAQLLIALVNTVLTGFLIHFMGIGKSLAFLSLIVFFCSFIPVAGVFISSVPICLVIMQDSGVGAMFLAALLIWVIHLIEAYILNPRIFGRHLRVNPVLVLIILTVGGKLFGVWGLILGLPVCKYFFGYAIQQNRAPAAS